MNYSCKLVSTSPEIIRLLSITDRANDNSLVDTRFKMLCYL